MSLVCSEKSGLWRILRSLLYAALKIIFIIEGLDQVYNGDACRILNFKEQLLKIFDLVNVILFSFCCSNYHRILHGKCTHTHTSYWSKISTNQGHYPDIGSGTSSVFSFCPRFSDVILQGTSGGYRLSDCKPDGYGIIFFTNIDW